MRLAAIALAFLISATLGVRLERRVDGDDGKPIVPPANNNGAPVKVVAPVIVGAPLNNAPDKKPDIPDKKDGSPKALPTPPKKLGEWQDDCNNFDTPCDAKFYCRLVPGTDIRYCEYRPYSGYECGRIDGKDVACVDETICREEQRTRTGVCISKADVIVKISHDQKRRAKQRKKSGEDLEDQWKAEDDAAKKAGDPKAKEKAEKEAKKKEAKKMKNISVVEHTDETELHKKYKDRLEDERCGGPHHRKCVRGSYCWYGIFGFGHCVPLSGYEGPCTTLHGQCRKDYKCDLEQTPPRCVPKIPALVRARHKDANTEPTQYGLQLDE